MIRGRNTIVSLIRRVYNVQGPNNEYGDKWFRLDMVLLLQPAVFIILELKDFGET